MLKNFYQIGKWQFRLIIICQVLFVSLSWGTTIPLGMLTWMTSRLVRSTRSLGHSVQAHGISVLQKNRGSLQCSRKSTNSCVAGSHTLKIFVGMPWHLKPITAATLFVIRLAFDDTSMTRTLTVRVHACFFYAHFFTQTLIAPNREQRKIKFYTTMLSWQAIMR